MLCQDKVMASTVNEADSLSCTKPPSNSHDLDFKYSSLPLPCCMVLCKSLHMATHLRHLLSEGCGGGFYLPKSPGCRKDRFMGSIYLACKAVKENVLNYLITCLDYSKHVSKMVYELRNTLLVCEY